jgi:glutamate/tyrosine decarboxylase-like PLP-dependent enzyme
MRPLGNLLLGLNQNLVKGEAAATLGPLERQTLAMLHRLVHGLRSRSTTTTCSATAATWAW